MMRLKIRGTAKADVEVSENATVLQLKTAVLAATGVPGAGKRLCVFYEARPLRLCVGRSCAAEAGGRWETVALRQ
jgi:hypothetical protein